MGEAGRGRETAGTTTCLIVRYVRGHAGDRGVERLLALAGQGRSAAELEDERGWSTYEQKIALFEAAATVLGDERVAVHIGESALEHRVNVGLRILLRTLGSPGMVVSNVARACPKFSTVATMEAPYVGRHSAVVTYELHPGKQPSRLDCDYNLGLIRVIGPLFGLPKLAVEHRECQVLGAPRCVYELSWRRRRRFWPRVVRRRELQDQVTMLTEQLESLQSTAADLVSSDDLPSVLARIVGRAGVAVSAKRYLLAVRPTENAPLSVHADGFDDPDEQRVAVEALLGDPVDVVDPSRLVIEVASARRNYGRLAAYYDEHAFFPQERALFAAYARSAAAALDAATALEKARSQGATAAALLKLARALADVSTPDDVAQRLAEVVPAVVGAQAAVVLLWNATDQELSVRGLHGWQAHLESRLARLVLRPPDSAGVTNLVTNPVPTFVRTCEMQDAMLRATVEGLEVDAVASVPIRQQGELLGLIVAGFDRPDEGTVRETVLERMAGVADHAATALQNGHLLERVTHQALHDELTGLPNRRLFEETVGSSLARAGRDGSSLALLFVDLDDFKLVNDELGHEHGDRILEGVADRLRASLRAGDVPARVGGDEFAVLLHDADRETALRLAERVRGAISEPIALDGRDVQVSASIGIAAHPFDGTTYGELLRRSDLAMYAAKASGGDMCRVYRRGSTNAEFTAIAPADAAPEPPGDGLTRAS